MSLSALEIGLVLTELAPKWARAQIQKIHMSGPRVALFTLRIPGETGVLRVSVEPAGEHICLTPERGESDSSASAFCMLMRKWLKGVKLTALEQVGGDRIIAFGSSRGSFRAELLGRRGRLIVCDDKNRVLAVSPSGAGRDGLLRGQPYEPPPPGAEAPQRACRFDVDGANEAVIALLGKVSESLEIDTGRAEVSRALSSLLKRQRRLVKKIEADRARAGSPQDLTKNGELLKINLNGLRRGMSSVTVDDVLDTKEPPEQVHIPLDPRLTPTENLDRIFAKARKARRTLEATRARLSDAHSRLGLLEGLREELDRACTDADVEAIGVRVQALGRSSARTQGRAKKKRSPRRLAYKTYLDASERRILVGRSAGDNDTLTVQVARPNDLWLHARGTTGSHVVIPLTRGEQVDSERLLDAATLAAHSSEARGNTTVEVTYTPRRYVQKLKGLPPGKVVLLREKVLLLTLEPARLKRLLSTHIDG